MREIVSGRRGAKVSNPAPRVTYSATPRARLGNQIFDQTRTGHNGSDKAE